MNKETDIWFEEFTGEHSKQLNKLRELILSINTDIKEVIKWKRPCYYLDNLVCYLKSNKTHITLGFERGIEIDDPDKVLQGEGKSMRHIKFKLTDCIDETLCKRLLRCAFGLELKP